MTITPYNGGPEIVDNTTTQGDQMYPSVAMANNGSYTVTWSGFGNQPGQGDNSGVFYQRVGASGAKVGTETRANALDVQNPQVQAVPSIGCDYNGNAVIVWMGPGGPTGGSSDVYELRTAPSDPVVDTAATDRHGRLVPRPPPTD